MNVDFLKETPEKYFGRLRHFIAGWPIKRRIQNNDSGANRILDDLVYLVPFFPNLVED